MLGNLVLLCLLSCVSGWIMIDKLSPSMPVEESYNTQVNNEIPISALNYAIIEHVKDMLGDISNNLDYQDTSGKKVQDNTKIYCLGDVLDKYSICRERCQMFNSTYQSIQCTTLDFVSYLTSCVTGTMECYAKDIDECLDNNGGCNQTCQNTEGSFSCSCLPGYILGDDGKSCTECDPGFLISDDAKSCNDINECDNNNGGCSQNCHNTDGSMYCSCDSGYILNLDGVTCQIKCGIETTFAMRIVNGEPVNDAHKYSWNVGISSQDNPRLSYICSGSVINSKHILTAAQCVSNGGTYFIGIGSNKKDEANIVIDTQQVFIHENYNSFTLEYDIAILELTRPIDLIRYAISPICIPKNDNNDYVGLNATVSGWGSTVGFNANDSPQPDPAYPSVLHDTQIPVLDNTECREKINGFTDLTLCAGDIVGFEEGGRDNCIGDGGAPLSVQDNGQYQVIGLVSSGSGCASQGNPAGYTRVSKFIEWINEKVSPETIYTISAENIPMQAI